MQKQSKGRAMLLAGVSETGRYTDFIVLTR
jgi:hypothetical protein